MSLEPMATLAPDASIPAARRHRPSLPDALRTMLARHGAVLAVVAASFAIRAPMFGNPMLEFDEQLYLLVGDRLLHGHLPYVELWDRKPIGLFLFYAAVRLFGGVGIVQYQIAATLCAAGTAVLIRGIAQRHAGPVAALVVAIAYLLALDPLHGTGGQAPVLYNLLTVAAARAAYAACETADRRRIGRLALFAMAMMGIAIQFKYTPVVEGVFFGCWFVWRSWRVGLPLGRLAALAAGMILLALLPTLAAIAFYAWAGHLDAFVQANFLSIFHRVPFPARTRFEQRVLIAIMTGPLVPIAVFACVRRWRDRAGIDPTARLLLFGWPLAALAGFGMLGDFYDFYFITVLPPLYVLVAGLLRPGRIGFAIGGLLLAWPVMLTPSYYARTADFERIAATLASAAQPYVRDRCLYVYDGPAVTYLLTHACAPTRYIYPDHLTNPTEATALGVDPVAEEARLLATRPGAIVTADRPVIPRVAPATQRLVAAAIARDYVLVARVPAIDRVFYVWALRTLHPGPAPVADARAAMPY